MSTVKEVAFRRSLRRVNAICSLYRCVVDCQPLGYFFVVSFKEGKYNFYENNATAIRYQSAGGEGISMIRAFNKHYRKAIDMIEDSTGSEKIETAEKVLEWFRQLPEEYLVSLALVFNEVIDDLGDESLEKIDLKVKRKREATRKTRTRISTKRRRAKRKTKTKTGRTTTRLGPCCRLGFAVQVKPVTEVGNQKLVSLRGRDGSIIGPAFIRPISSLMVVERGTMFPAEITISCSLRGRLE